MGNQDRSVLDTSSNTGTVDPNEVPNLDALLRNSDRLSYEQKQRSVKSKSVLISARKSSVVAELSEVWDYRELIFSFVRRDLTTRYRQTVLGVGWAIVQPVCMMLVFTLFLGRFVHPPTESCPYPVFVYTALIVWQYISASSVRCSNSVLDAGGLIKKVYFPRLSVPIASVMPSIMDFAIGLVSLLVLMTIYGITLSSRICFLPVFMALAVVTSLGLGLWTSALHVKYRDIHHIVPFGLQLWLFASPVIYSSTQIPPHLKLLSNLNPLVGIIEGFRWCLLGTTGDIILPAVSCAVVSLFLIISGFTYFRSVEDLFADYL